MTGVCFWWNPDRGWGFLTTEQMGDVFVHHAALDDDGDLLYGEVVEFDPLPGTVGTVAANVRRAA